MNDKDELLDTARDAARELAKPENGVLRELIILEQEKDKRMAIVLSVGLALIAVVVGSWFFLDSPWLTVAGLFFTDPQDQKALCLTVVTLAAISFGLLGRKLVDLIYLINARTLILNC